MNTTKSINSIFGFEPAIPGFTFSNKLIDLKYNGEKNDGDIVRSEMCVCIDLVMFSLRIYLP